jgi:hypothetical protein
MNTTNLITDYIISGFLGLLALLIPWCMLDHTIIMFILNMKIEKETIIAIGVVLISYSFGVLYNQIADYLEDTFFNLFGIKIVVDAETKLKTALNFDHHYALQLVVSKSESAYEYISFRRTMIRIVRALLCLFIFIPTLHLIYLVIFHFEGKFLIYSRDNLVIIIMCLFLIFISTKVLIKLYKGYYAAITNFALILNE